jgi:hypothetical protein
MTKQSAAKPTVRIIKASAVPQFVCNALWYEDSAGRERLLGAYPSYAEARQAQAEEFKHLGAAWRFAISEYSQAELEQLG